MAHVEGVGRLEVVEEHDRLEGEQGFVDGFRRIQNYGQRGARIFGSDADRPDAVVFLVHAVVPHPLPMGTRSSRCVGPVGFGFGFVPESLDGEPPS